MKILLDAGHGGQDPGALSFTGEEERDFTLAIVLAMNDMLISMEPTWEIICTRYDDTTLSPNTRRRMIEQIQPNAFVSVHCNAATKEQANGAEVIYRDKLDEPLARAILANLVSSLPVRNRGIKTDVGDLRRSLAVLSTPNIPSVIVEPGFLTNDNDLVVLGRTHDIAAAIVRGIQAWAEL